MVTFDKQLWPIVRARHGTRRSFGEDARIIVTCWYGGFVICDYSDERAGFDTRIENGELLWVDVVRRDSANSDVSKPVTVCLPLQRSRLPCSTLVREVYDIFTTLIDHSRSCSYIYGG